MGVDLRVITGHRLSAAAVLNFGATLNNDPILKELEFYSAPRKTLKDWHETATVEQLTEQWKRDLASAKDTPPVPFMITKTTNLKNMKTWSVFIQK